MGCGRAIVDDWVPIGTFYRWGVDECGEIGGWFAIVDIEPSINR